VKSRKPSSTSDGQGERHQGQRDVRAAPEVPPPEASLEPVDGPPEPAQHRDPPPGQGRVEPVGQVEQDHEEHGGEEDPQRSPAVGEAHAKAEEVPPHRPPRGHEQKGREREGPRNVAGDGEESPDGDGPQSPLPPRALGGEGQGTAPRYHRLIKGFGKATRVPVLLNTSFNLKSEPIRQYAV
jgi:hypothetical protein